MIFLLFMGLLGYAAGKTRSIWAFLPALLLILFVLTGCGIDREEQKEVYDARNSLYDPVLVSDKTGMWAEVITIDGQEYLCVGRYDDVGWCEHRGAPG